MSALKRQILSKMAEAKKFKNKGKCSMHENWKNLQLKQMFFKQNELKLVQFVLSRPLHSDKTTDSPRPNSVFSCQIHTNIQTLIHNETKI